MKTIRVNLKKFFDTNGKKGLRKASLEKYIKTQIQNMIRVGSKSEKIKDFIKESKKAMKAFSSTKLTKRRFNKISQFLSNHIVAKYDKQSKLTWTLEYKKTIRIKGSSNWKRDKNSYLNRVLKKYVNKSTVNLYKKQTKGRKELVNLNNSLPEDIYDILMSMGGGDINYAYQAYPIEVTRLINDYLGIDLEEFLENGGTLIDD